MEASSSRSGPALDEALYSLSTELSDRKAPQVSETQAARGHELAQDENDEGLDGQIDAMMSTGLDSKDMDRLGKQQVLVRHFPPMATFAFVAMATSVWEFGIFSVNQGLVNGGRPALIWMTVVHAIGFIPIVLSMAEMASIAPTMGSQYHWVSEFAHPRLQKWLSYLTGWITTMAWQAGNAIGVFLTGTLVQVIILVNNSSYAFPAWHGSLLVMSNIVFTVAANIYLSRYIPRVQTLFFVFHVLAFFCFFIPILAYAPKASARQVFTEFENTGGWSSMGFAVLAGQLSAIYMMCGTDSSCNIAEEVRDASKTLPRTMLAIFGVNMAFTLVSWLVICFAMPDVGLALEHPSLYPMIYIMEQSMSPTWITVELTMIVCLVLFANVCYLTAVSRALFAFARDGGTPFPNWVARIHPRFQTPVNAVYVTATFSFLLSLIYIGSETAFYAITSLMTVALLQCYLFSISSMLWRRIYKPETIPASPFSLGAWGIPVNASALVWCAWAFFWSFWPQYTPTTAETFNWASVIFIAVIVVAVIHYYVYGHKTYHGPVLLVKRV